MFTQFFSNCSISGPLPPEVSPEQFRRQQAAAAGLPPPMPVYAPQLMAAELSEGLRLTDAKTDVSTLDESG